MRIGFGLPVSGSWATPANQAEVAGRAEAGGFAGLWAFQRLLYPAGPPPGPPWGEPYRSVLDPLLSLAHVAGLTRRIRLGVAVINAPFVPPVLLAKQASTLDLLSAGRLDLGLGLGWAHEEYSAVGVPMQARGARLEEYVAVLEQIFADTAQEWSGRFYQLPAAHQHPVPQQRPRPPILLGASAEPALRRAGRIADGWVSSSRAPLGELGRMIAVVAEAAEQSGRDPGRLRFVCRGAVRLRAAVAGQRDLLIGSVEQIREDLDRLAAAGLTETFLDINFDPEVGSPDADPEQSMDRARALLEAFGTQS